MTSWLFLRYIFHSCDFSKNWFLLNAIKLFKTVILVLKLLRTFKFFKNLSDKSDKYVEVVVKCSDIKLTKCLSFNWLNSLCFVATETVSSLFFSQNPFFRSDLNWLLLVDEIIVNYCCFSFLLLVFTEHHGIRLDQAIVTFRDEAFASTRIKRTNNNEKHFESIYAAYGRGGVKSIKNRK